MANLKPFGLFILLFVTLLSSCKKNKSDSTKPEEELQYNQIREEYGLRFILTWQVADGSYAQDFAQFDLELYKGAGATKSATPMKLVPKESEFVNYSILTDSLTDGGEYTLAINYEAISKNGQFNLHVEGYTAIQNAKKFNMPNNAFTTANAKTKRDFLKIRRDGTKYTFMPL